MNEKEFFFDILDGILGLFYVLGDNYESCLLLVSIFRNVFCLCEFFGWLNFGWIWIFGLFLGFMVYFEIINSKRGLF